MTEQNKESNLDMIESKQNKKSNFVLLKFLLLMIVIFLGFTFYHKFRVKNSRETKHIVIKNESVKESEILEIADDEKYKTTLHDLNISEIKEKGAEFVYQLLIKNQVQIEDLSNQVNNLKTDLIKLRNQEKFNRLVFNYIELREKLFNGENCNTEIESYELLTINDEFLKSKFAVIKNNYKNLHTPEELISSFKLISKQLIINENYIEEKASFAEKIRHNLKKLVVIRKTDKNKSSNLEALIIDIENALKQRQYQDALNKLLTLDKIYFPIIQKFLEDMNVFVEIENADKEIIKYFKSLT